LLLGFVQFSASRVSIITTIQNPKWVGTYLWNLQIVHCMLFMHLDNNSMFHQILLIWRNYHLFNPKLHEKISHGLWQGVKMSSLSHLSCNPKKSPMVSNCINFFRAFQMLHLSTPNNFVTPLLLAMDELDANKHTISITTTNWDFCWLVRCLVMFDFIFETTSWLYFTCCISKR